MVKGLNGLESELMNCILWIVNLMTTKVAFEIEIEIDDERDIICDKKF